MPESTSPRATTAPTDTTPSVPLPATSAPGARVLCPYCGRSQPVSPSCEACRGLFEPLSRQATQNAMGPWQIRSEGNPFAPGCSFAKLKDLVARGRVQRETVIRGPSTRQFWALACNTPGVAALLGECHACHARVDPDDYMCKRCGSVLTCPSDRQHLGLGPVKLLPWEASAAEVASSGLNLAAHRSASPAAPDAGSVAPATGVQSSDREPRPSRAEPWRSMFLSLLSLIVLVALITAAALLTREPAPPPIPPPAPQIVRVPPDTSAVLSAVAALEAEGSRGSLEAAAAALRPLFEQAERTGDLPAAAALRARLDAIAVRLDEAQLKDALQP